MIDGGRIRNKDKIIPYLKDLGVTTIDAIIGSHVQYNHSQAHAAIVENFNVKKAYYPVDPNNCVKEKSCESRDVEYHKDALKKYGINTEILRASSGGIPRKIQIGAMELYFLYPVKIGTSQNGNSFIFILKYKNNTFMFTGDTPATNVDASSSRLKAIKDNAKALGISLDVDVLKWPHHGNSTVSKAFLDVVKPEYTIIPNFGHSSHPTSENRSKVEKAGSKIYELKKHGNIVILSNGNKIEIKTNQKAADYKR